MKTIESIGAELEYTLGQFRLRFTTDAELYEWMGPTFRGALGRSIRDIVCLNSNMKNCEDCKRRDDCLYYCLYEQKRSLRGHTSPPKPVILIPPYLGKKEDRIFKKGSELYLDFLTLGKFNKYIPHLILSLQKAGEYGVGNARHLGKNKFEIVEGKVLWEDKPFYENGRINLSYYTAKNLKDIKPIEGKKIKVKFKTPFGGLQIPLTMERYLFYTKNRIIRYVNEYGNRGFVPGDVKKGEKIMGSPVYVKKRVLKRRSARSNKDRFIGYLGEVEYRIGDLGDAERWLIGVSEFFGLGPNSSFGMGFVELMKY